MNIKSTLNSEHEIGVQLGAIIQDERSRAKLIENPAEVLSEIGLSADVTLLADKADLVHLLIPADIDAARVAADDEAYFEDLGKAALGTCYYDDLPE